MLPATLAARFLRHSDVFKQAGDDEAETAEQTEPTDPDTTKVLDEQQKQLDEQRQQEDARFALLDTIDSMDRKALIDWAEQHYKQKIPGNVSAATARDMAKGFIDQYGMPA